MSWLQARSGKERDFLNVSDVPSATGELLTHIATSPQGYLLRKGLTYIVRNHPVIGSIPVGSSTSNDPV